MLLIVECLKWGMHVRCEHQCVSEVALLRVPFVASVGVQCVKMSPIEHVTCDH